MIVNPIPRLDGGREPALQRGPGQRAEVDARALVADDDLQHVAVRVQLVAAAARVAQRVDERLADRCTDVDVSSAQSGKCSAAAVRATTPRASGELARRQ